MRKLLITCVVLGFLAVGADLLAKNVAEGKVADLIESRESLSTTPDVSFAGFPFLTQVPAGEFDQVDVSLPTVEARAGEDDSVQVQDVVATFHHVRTSHGFSQATAESVTGRATISYNGLDELTAIKTSYAGTNLAGDGLVKIESSNPRLPGEVTVGIAVLDGSAIGFVGADGTTRLPEIPFGLELILGSLLQQGHPMTGLPSDITVKSLKVTKAGLILALSGQDLALAS